MAGVQALMAMSEQFSTRTVPQAERPDYMREALARVLGADIGVRPTSRAGVQADLRRMSCGPLQLLQMAGEGYLSERRGCGRPDWISVMVQLEGATRARHGRSETRLVAGDLCIMPPSGALVVERPQHFHQVLVDVPQDLLDEACPGWNVHVLERIEAQRTGVRCLGEVLRLVLNHDSDLGAPCREEFSHTALALLAQAVAGSAPAGAGPGAGAAGGGRAAELHRRRVQQHVRENLRDPELSVASVAGALGLSPRYVHKLFDGEGTTLMRWVQQERLARRGTRTIADIAFDWGFSHPAHFSRAYRRLFGVAPSER